MTPAQLDALKAAGGCDHTPDPFIPCIVCRRPSLASERVTAGEIIAWQATTIDGGIISSTDRQSIDNIPFEVVEQLVVLTSDPRMPRVTLKLQPEKGERVRRFSRQIHRMHSTGEGGKLKPGMKMTVEVFEIANANNERTRLYIHPIEGPFLSTKDLYW